MELKRGLQKICVLRMFWISCASYIIHIILSQSFPIGCSQVIWAAKPKYCVWAYQWKVQNAKWYKPSCNSHLLWGLMIKFSATNKNPTFWWNIVLLYRMSPKSVTLTISENIPKPRNKFWNFFNCTDSPNPWPKHPCLSQGLGVSVHIEKVQKFISWFWYIFRNS